MKESAPTKLNIASNIHNTEPKSKSKRGKKVPKNNIPPVKQPRTSSFDFLSSLFE